MITRRVTLEVEVPMECAAVVVLVAASSALNDLGIRNRARITLTHEDDRPEIVRWEGAQEL